MTTIDDAKEVLEHELRFWKREAEEWKKLSNQACEIVRRQRQELRDWRGYSMWATGFLLGIVALFAAKVMGLTWR